jgi:hypothetical protein
MPDNKEKPIEQKKEAYKSLTNAIIPYKDPFSEKEFYVVKGSKKNINSSDVFLVDTDAGGSPVYATYKKPEGKNLWQLDYERQQVKEYNDGKQQIDPISSNLTALMSGKNTFQNRRYLQDYMPDNIYPNADLNKTVAERQKLFDPDRITPMPQKVTTYYDNNDQIKTDNGVVFTTPGRKFKKINDDGTEELISAAEYFKLKPLNSMIDPNKKSQFLTGLEQ